MAQSSQNQELIDRFVRFYRNYYRDEISRLAQRYPNEQRSLHVDYDDLYQFDQDLADDFLSQPDQIGEFAEEALRVYDLPADVSLGQAHVRLRNLPDTVDIRSIRVHDNHVGRMIAVSGIIRKATDVRPKITEAAFECQRCGTMTYIPQSDGGFQEPHECQGCERQGPFRVNYDQSEFVDSQKLRVQESPEGLRGGETPQSIDVDIEDDITGEVTAGDHVTVTGVLHIEQVTDGNEKSQLFDLYMDGVSVQIEDEQFEEMEISEADKKDIVDLSNHPDIYDEMVASVAPSIYGYDQEKLAMILQLFSGVTKNLPDGSRIRGDLHMLLIGDPGTGKCQKHDTKIVLGDGTVRTLGELVESRLENPVSVDDGVYEPVDFSVQTVTADGNITVGQATKVWKREAPERMYRIRTKSGREVEVTPSHPLFVRNNLGMEPQNAEELNEGRFIALPRRLDSEWDDSLDIDHYRVKSGPANRIDTPEKLSPELARLLGYQIGEGHVTGPASSATATITNADEAVLSDVADCLDLLGLHWWRKPHHDRDGVEMIGCSSVEFVDFLREIEPAILKRSADQRVPDCLFRASPSIKQAFLKAYVEGEGHVSRKEREITVASMSRELLEGVRSLLLGLGIEASLGGRQNGSYRLRISGTDFVSYVEEIGFVTERKTVASTAFADVSENTNTDIIPDVSVPLRRIREALALSQFDCGIPRTTYQHHERGDRNPSRRNLRTVLGQFEARLEWLNDMREQLERGDWSDIERLRRELNLSQDELANAAGVSQKSISNYERNVVTPDGGVTQDARNAVRDRINEAMTVADEIGALQQLVESDVSWDRIESIETVDPDYDWVYDLEVAGTHTYLGNGIVSHNSQLLSYIRNIAPRSVYTSGKGSSSAGLTAAAVRDDFGDGQQWSLEAGALVLADQGIAAVDELDKMRPEDRSAMHEALEQQSYHPSSEILLADGRRVEIGDFVDEAMADRPEDVVDGVNCDILPVDDVGVHSVDFETNDVGKEPVDRVSRHEAPDEFVRVTFSNGRSVLVTPEHPMFVERDGETTTVDASDVEEGSFVPAPRKLPNSTAGVSLDEEPHRGKEKDVGLPDELTPDLAEILGLLVAEGHSYAGSSHEIGFSNQDERLLNRMERLMSDVFGMTSSDTTNAAGTVTQQYISRKLYRWFESNVPEVMHTARGKRIPAAVLGASEEAIRRFLVGAFAGDGGVESEAMSFSTASEGLAEDYADALAKIGVASRIHHDAAEDAWKTYVMGDSTAQFVDAVVEPADDRSAKARAFAERSEATKRHHDVLPSSAAAEIRSLRRLLGLQLTGELKSNLDEGYGVQIETVERHVETLRDRVRAVRFALDEAGTLGDVRAAVDWSGRQLADRLDGETTSAVHYAESGGYDTEHRATLTAAAQEAVSNALDDATKRLDALEERCELRYYRVSEVESVPNEGEYACDYVYDVTVEPTNTFVSQGVALHNSISISKAGINATLKSRCSLLGAANPKYGRFDQYEPIGEQIDLEPALISRFDLIFTVTDQPDPDEDAALAEHILRTNYAGELNTQRTEVANPDHTESEVESVTETVEPAIDPDLLRKYIAYAKRSCFPTMSDGAREAIRDFYVDLRAKGADEDAPVPVTARKLEALVRLAEASARVRLSDTVERDDAERVIEIVRSCLQDIGVDPETGEFDADVIETGTSKSQRDRIKSIKDVIETVDAEYEGEAGAPLDAIVERAEAEGIEEEKVMDQIEQLRRKGDVYSPSNDQYKVV
ncbi:LAGLIDADG family homing endonuclease [Haloplanus halophilus]|uniref:LAGLIDADG family homing endonuclease n=1 Tax=Haloplanus halophilus TaxID=2949993 RepID=UPI002040C913|nr:LAGLIDADG family homing endonuclease [Haloplanus sp. GDY1]